MIQKISYRLILFVFTLLLSFGLVACTNSQSGNTLEEEKEITSEEIEMKLWINDTNIPVTWENNEAVKELKEQSSKETIEVNMSMYGDWEQVGSLQKSYTRNDTQLTANNGDIMLYCGNQIVLFYGQNSWSYTKLGKMNLSEKEITALLSNGDVKLTITCEN